MAKPQKPAAREIELRPDGWEWFKEAVHAAAKSGPKHRGALTPKAKERPAPKRGVRKDKARALAIGMIALTMPNIAIAEGIAKKVCIIAGPNGETIQQIDAPNGSAAGTFCTEQLQKFLAGGRRDVSLRLACFTQDIPDWTDGLHELSSAPCKRLR